MIVERITFIFLQLTAGLKVLLLLLKREVALLLKVSLLLEGKLGSPGDWRCWWEVNKIH